MKTIFLMGIVAAMFVTVPGAFAHAGVEDMSDFVREDTCLGLSDDPSLDNKIAKIDCRKDMIQERIDDMDNKHKYLQEHIDEMPPSIHMLKKQQEARADMVLVLLERSDRLLAEQIAIKDSNGQRTDAEKTQYNKRTEMIHNHIMNVVERMQSGCASLVDASMNWHENNGKDFSIVKS